MTANKILIFPIMAITLFYTLGGKTDRDKKICIQIITVILTCFSGFRSWQMGDVYHYCNSFLVCNMPGWKIDFESNDTIGLQLFFHIIGRLGGSFEICLFLIAAFVAITLGILVYRYSPSLYWSYVIYLAMGFYISSFNILKQIIAMGFITLAMMAIFERKPIRFLILVLVAALFHQPALIFLAAYPFANKKVDATYGGIIAVLVAVVFLFRDQIVRQATELYYVDDMSFQVMDDVGNKVVVMVLILIFALIMRPLRNYDVYYRQIFSIMVLATVVQTFAVYDNVFSRLADYFFQFSVLFIPMLLQPGTDQAIEYPEHRMEMRYFTVNSYLLIQICITAFAVLYYFSYINGNADLLNGFHFFWEVDTPSSLELLEERLMMY